MPKPDPKKIEKELKKQEDEFSGEETLGGSNEGLEKDDDTNEGFQKTFGNEPEKTIAEEIEEDEKDLRKSK